jgi:hypothetical protein
MVNHRIQLSGPAEVVAQRRSGFLASHLKVAFFADNKHGSNCASWSYG